MIELLQMRQGWYLKDRHDRFIDPDQTFETAAEAREYNRVECGGRYWVGWVS